VPAEGDVVRDPELADGIERLARDGAAPFYTGDIGAAAADWVAGRGGTLSRADLAGYATVPREPVRVRYHGREVLTNPPPSAGGLLIAYALALLQRGSGPPGAPEIVDAMEAAQAERTPAFLEELGTPGFMETFLTSRLGSTTHVSVLDSDGWACAVTTTNGEGSGIVVPGTGIHVNNMMGEEDLSPAGWFKHPPGRRLPSMMAPTVVLDEGSPELVLGSAGSNRIRSAILQVIVNAIDHGMEAQAAVDAPRLHLEDGLVYAEPGIDGSALEAAGRKLAWFREPNLFFGGCQAVERHHETRAFSGGGDPRRGGAVVRV
jgi:gamma-glutamyltranspeptidase/glutathione hydrolase